MKNNMNNFPGTHKNIRQRIWPKNLTKKSDTKIRHKNLTKNLTKFRFRGCSGGVQGVQGVREVFRCRFRPGGSEAVQEAAWTAWTGSGPVQAVQGRFRGVQASGSWGVQGGVSGVFRGRFGAVQAPVQTAPEYSGTLRPVRGRFSRFVRPSEHLRLDWLRLIPLHVRT